MRCPSPTLSAGAYVFCALAAWASICDNPANAQVGNTDASGEITVQDIFDAWSARHEQVNSARFNFTEERVLLPGSRWGRGNRTLDDEGNKFPTEPLTLVREHEVVFDGIQARRDRRGDDWHIRAEGPVPEHLVELSDSERELMYFGYEERTDDIHPRADISPANGEHPGVFFGQVNSVLAIFITFRAHHPAFSRPSGPGPFNALRYRLLESEGTVDGRRCLILDDTRSAELDQRRRIWVDPERDFVTIRSEVGTSNLVLFQLDIQYEGDESGLWVPVRWTTLTHGQHVNGGRVLTETATFTVTNYALNPAIDDAVFDFEPPSGTWANNYKSDERQTFLTQDGRVRPVTEDELMRGARYSDLLNTDSGEALLPPGQTSWRWIWLALAVALAGFAWLTWRRQ